MAAVHAGIPISTTINTVNRQCLSALTAVNQITIQIAVGQINIGISAGVESMTQGYGPQSMPPEYAKEILANLIAEDCLLPMGITSRNVTTDFNISCFDQDAFAALSFQRASSAFKAGKFCNEILPVRTKATDPKSGKTLEIMLKLAFSDAGSTHAGNASQVSDEAAAVLLARRSTAKKLRLPIVGKFVAAVAVGVPPRIMGIRPAVAILKVLDKTSLSKSDIDFYEINEAFASQAIYCIRQLEISMDKVNIHGGAIAIGHPLGCTGVRQIATGLNIAK
ncbi:putative thiolase, C-terminal domain [Lyophyllum shimeji]|uniref:Thiolase, C-terminal domain n=1 Tax=Lyophyllum shimeji TaxID=47721 RepID=A0A9P3PWS2_LYOSH|nr:putative thiolase, C-terminal domain [Lyophyllum shimeji]GLB43023.1 putative thiolase, C-terminal domain [Lyophyllum shimeji]